MNENDSFIPQSQRRGGETDEHAFLFLPHQPPVSISHLILTQSARENMSPPSITADFYHNKADQMKTPPELAFLQWTRPAALSAVKEDFQSCCVTTCGAAQIRLIFS